MDSAKPSMLRRVLAVLVLVLIAAVALRLAVGLVVGLFSAVFWILVVVALVAAGLWARSTLKSANASGRKPFLRQGGHRRAGGSGRGRDARITEQLREQGRR